MAGTRHHSTTHTATVRSGPNAGSVYSCDCSRTLDHYLAMSPGMMDLHPTLFDPLAGEGDPLRDGETR